MELLLIRHGESEGNRQRRMQGQGDYPLSATGEHQVQQLAQRLAQEFAPPTHLYASPLQRTRQTATAILAALPAQPDPVACEYPMAIAEGSAGIFTGLTWEEARQHYPALCEQLETSLDWIAIPEAESPHDIRDRAHHWLQQVMDRHRSGLHGGDRVWVITHEWMLYQLVSVLLGCDRTWQFAVDHTALFEFRLDGERWHRHDPNTRYNSTLWQIRRFNDTQHLCL